MTEIIGDKRIITPSKSIKLRNQLADKYYGRGCVFSRVLHRESSIDYEKLYRKISKSFISSKWDMTHAHVFGSGSHPHMKMIPLNTPPMTLYCHTLIDQLIHPYTDEKLDHDKWRDLWRWILGDIYEVLDELSKSRLRMAV